MKCTKCGEEIRTGTSFCGKCGEKLPDDKITVNVKGAVFGLIFLIIVVIINTIIFPKFGIDEKFFGSFVTKMFIYLTFTFWYAYYNYFILRKDTRNRTVKVLTSLIAVTVLCAFFYLYLPLKVKIFYPLQTDSRIYGSDYFFIFLILYFAIPITITLLEKIIDRILGKRE